MTTLYVEYKNQEDLAAFAREVFRILKITDVEQHQSSNYPRGYYFAGRALGIKLNVSLADTVGFEAYDYWLTVAADWKLERPSSGVWSMGIQRDALDAVLDIVARRLTVASFEVACCLDPTTSETVTYRTEGEGDEHTVKLDSSTK